MTFPSFGSNKRFTHIWEIDGSRRYYLELLALFDRQATEDDLIRYLKS